MSRQSGAHVDQAPRTISCLCPWALTKPAAKQSLDFLNASVGMTPLEILAHQIEPSVEQIERRAKGVGD
jgi:hypothetical protein